MNNVNLHIADKIQKASTDTRTMKDLRFRDFHYPEY